MIKGFDLDHIQDIDEIRTGFHGQTFHRLRRRGALKPNDVIPRNSPPIEWCIFPFRKHELFRSYTTIIDKNCIY